MTASALLGLMSLLAGEFNNNEQVWQQTLDGEPTSARTHFAWQRLNGEAMSLSINIPIDISQVPSAPEWTFDFFEQDGTVRSTLRGHDCAYDWSRDGEAYQGVMLAKSDCPDSLPASWRIDQDWLIAGADEEIKARRVIYYTGWIALSRRHIDETAEADDYIFLSDVRVHDEGFVTPILDDGKPTGYAVELAHLTYQNTRTPVLKLGVIEEATGKTLAYAWANPGAMRIGINLRWMQCGFTRLDHSPRSGAASSPSATR